MADAVLVLDSGGLRSFACPELVSWRVEAHGDVGNLPAPGGPMRIIRIDSALGCLLPPASSRCSSSHILDSSLCTWSFKFETMSSVIGAIVRERL